MGYSLSWVAVQGSTPSAVQSVLKLRSTGTHEDFPESEIVGASIPAGWYLIVSQGDGLCLLEESTLKGLSLLGEVITCLVEEHVMASSAACWRGGRPIWRIDYQSISGKDSLLAEGTLPISFIAIRNALFIKQRAEGDNQTGTDFIFDVPITLAQTVTGYRYDTDVNGLDTDGFEILERH
jgi:hypothetical protein